MASRVPLIAFVSAILSAGPVADAKALFGPPDKAAALHADPDASYDFVISAKGAFPAGLRTRIAGLIEPNGDAEMTDLPLITSVMAKLHVRDAEALVD